MSVFAKFEQEVVRELISPKLHTDQITAVLNSASIVSYEHTGVGYFLTVRHTILPLERIVCDEPLIIGRCGDVECGFVVFLENGELTLECHSWDNVNIPKNIREQLVEIGLTGVGV